MRGEDEERGQDEGARVQWPGDEKTRGQVGQMNEKRKNERTRARGDAGTR